MSNNSNEIVQFTKYLYKIPEAMALLSMSRSVIYEQMRAGRLRFVKQGRATLVSASAIRDYVALLEEEAGVHYGETA
jgi:excisionase family DNA binding protein